MLDLPPGRMGVPFDDPAGQLRREPVEGGGHSGVGVAAPQLPGNGLSQL